MQQLEETGEVDVLRIVSVMRQDRGGMVQTKEQYLFLHQVSVCMCVDRILVKAVAAGVSMCVCVEGVSSEWGIGVSMCVCVGGVVYACSGSMCVSICIV